MPEGYQPSPAELGLTQEIFEANGISEEETDHGFRHLDAEGRVVLQTETWGETQQATQFTYGEGNAMTEQGKALTGPEEGKLFTREHPRTPAEFPVRVDDPDIGDISGQISGHVETLAGTVGPDGALVERWANLEVTDPSFVEKFSAIPLDRRQTGERGEIFCILRGDFSSPFDLEVNGKKIAVTSVKKLSVTFNEAGQATKINFGTITWEEKPRE